MKGKIQKNSRGSVLLAVVCMTMVCLTLATIALSVVNYTTGASNRNVQRTQAKVTAEAALTEFINQYHSIDADYAGLKALVQGNDRDTAYTIDVDMQGDPTFDQYFGDCKIYIYNTSGGFKVESVCNFASQEQTASVVFKSISTTPFTPSNTLAARNGADISQGRSAPVAGDVYIERTDGSSAGAIAPSNGKGDYDHYTGNFYSEYNVILNTSGLEFTDGYNTTGTTNFYHDTEYFKQAPTVTVKGYFAFQNSGNTGVYTTVGKSNVDKKNSDDYATKSDYYKSELSNTDGYLNIYNKYLSIGDPIDIGKSGYPIDLYCRGAYFGPIPKELNGVATDYNEINSAFDNIVSNFAAGGDRYRQPKIYGNLYSFKGQSDVNQSGDLVVNSVNGLYVYGDVFVDGDIYILGTDSKLYVQEDTMPDGTKVGGNLYCTGNIYQCEADVNPSTWQIDGYIVKYTSKIEYDSAAGKYVIKYASGAPTNQITVKNEVGNSIDPSKPRNNIPDDGYDPATGNTSSSRKGLDVFQTSTPNNMFESSAKNLTGANGQDLRQAAKEISDKYAIAMTRSMSDTFTDPDGAVKNVTENISGNIYQINGSLRLTSAEARGNSSGATKNFIVKLTNQDIVILLPVGVNINANFRIDRSGDMPTYDASGNLGYHYCYFMYYDESELTISADGKTFNDKCLYYNDIWSYTSEGKTCNIEAGSTSGKFTRFSKEHTSPYVIADYNTIAAAVGNANISDNFGYSSRLPDSVLNDPAHQNYSMILIPDGLDFKVEGNGVYIQSIVYGPKADVAIEGSQSTIYGKVNCNGFTCPQDIGYPMIQEIREAEGSILGFADAANAVVSETKVQYYQY